jgi:SPP1 gp7 family putative phage head morphogenesis protein
MIKSPITLDPQNPLKFEEACQWFQKQAPWISGSSWVEMARLAVLKGEQLRQAALLSMVDDIWSRIGRSLDDGEPYSEFVRNIGKNWGVFWERADSPRLRLIWHNAVGGALMSGKWRQISSPVVRAVRPLLLFDAIEDHRTSEICLARDGVILPADDPFWKSNYPLLHHDCRSSVITLDAEEAEEFGGVRGLPSGAVSAADGWGGIRAWEDWEPKKRDYHPALWEEFQKWKSGETYASKIEDWHKALGKSWGKALQIDAEDLTAFFNLPLETDPKIVSRAAVHVRPALDSVAANIRTYLDAWVLGSRTKKSTTLKLAAQAELSLPGIAFTLKDAVVSDTDVQKLRPAVRRIYEDTQIHLQKAGLEEVTLYRGWRRSYGVRGILESWTTDPAIAKKFNGGKFGGVEMRKVKVQDIFALSGGPHFKNGKYGEQHEYILLAGRLEEK